MAKKFEHRDKCRCGAWLYGRRITMGFCSKCGPGEDQVAHAGWCAVFVLRECNCGAFDKLEMAEAAARVIAAMEDADGVTSPTD